MMLGAGFPDPVVVSITLRDSRPSRLSTGPRPPLSDSSGRRLSLFAVCAKVEILTASAIPRRAAMTNVPLLSVIFITYQRLDLLRRTCSAFECRVTYPRLEWIVCDDGSPRAMQEGIRRLPFDRYLLSPENRGLGANNNAGLRAATGRYILMMQDDWDATPLASAAIERALAILEHDNEVGMVRFYPGAIGHYPLEARRLGGVEYFVCDHRSPGYDPRHPVYSDTPHIRKAEMNDPALLGLYRENVPMETSEQDYSDRFDRQSRYRIAFLDRGESVIFIHTGSAHSHRTSKLRYRLDRALLALAAGLGLQRESTLYGRLRSVWFAVRDWLIERRLLP